MMNSFGRQEGGGFRWREGKLVSPVRREEEVGKTTPPLLKVPPPAPWKVMRRGRRKKVEKKGEGKSRESRRKKRC